MSGGGKDPEKLGEESTSGVKTNGNRSLIRFGTDLLTHSFRQSLNIFKELGALEELHIFMGSAMRHGIGVPHAEQGRAELLMGIPGVVAGDWSLEELYRFVKILGHSTYHSGIVSNVRPGEKYIPELSDKVNEITYRRRKPINLLGHSLGASIAIIISQEMPDQVKRIISFAGVTNSQIGVAPGLLASLVPAALLDLFAFGPTTLSKEVDLFYKLDEPFKVPAFLFYSQNDRILAKETTTREGPDAVFVEYVSENGILVPKTLKNEGSQADITINSTADLEECLRNGITTVNIKTHSTHTGMIVEKDALEVLSYVLRTEVPVRQRQVEPIPLRPETMPTRQRLHVVKSA